MKIHILDHDFFEPRVIASFLIETKGELILIESGPDSTFPKLKAAIEAKGFTVEDIKKVFLTHIHLDHAGAAWHFADHGATIYVHPRGAKHLAKPQRLIESAKMIFKEQMDELWGTMNPIPEHLIHPLEDGEEVRLENTTVRTIETLGHASHHNSYLVGDAVFVGDVGGVRISHGPVLPPTPPPDINVEHWQASIKKIKDIKPSKLYPTHFGRFSDYEEHFDELEENLLNICDWIGECIKKGKTEEQIIPEYETLAMGLLNKRGVDEQLTKSYQLADPFWMNVSGLIRYWTKFRT